MLFAGHTGVFLGYMEFVGTDEFEPFALVCRFDSTRRGEPWRYALVPDHDWSRIRPRYHKHYNYLSEAFLGANGWRNKVSIIRDIYTTDQKRSASFYRLEVQVWTV
jgi:hypothetical protein